MVVTKAEQEWSLIEALEYCKGKRPLNKCCAGCPYAGVGCAIDVAISKLKAQEPRVMTSEEVRCANEEPMWFESKGTFRGRKGFWVLSKGVSPSYVIRLIPTIGKDDTELSLAAYGKVWRCWTSRPTDNQREAEPWIKQ